MKKYKVQIFLALILLAVFVLPAVPVEAYSLGDPIVPDCTDVNGKCLSGFNEFMTLINNVIYFVLFGLAIPISAIMFAYAGFLMLTSGGDTSKVGTAKTIFTNVAIGLILASISFLIVNALLSILGFDGSWIGFKKDI